MKVGNLKKVLSCLMALAVAMTFVIAGPQARVFAEESTSMGSTPPEIPSGGAQGDMTPPANSNGDVPDKPDGEAPDGEAPGGEAPGGMGGNNSAVTSWSAVTEITSDTNSTDETFSSTGTDENAIHVSGGKYIIGNPAITRTSSDSTGGDNSSFYGVGAAVLTTGGTTYIRGGNITTDSKGGAGIFSYGDGVTYASGTAINTTQDTSGGIHVAGGGTLYAWDVNAVTNGESSAAIRSDRGGGKMVVDGGYYTSNGKGSPAVYSTADITVNSANLAASKSEGVCIEGLNSLRLFDSNLTCNMPDDDQNDTTWSVILYQSQSGDSEEGNSTFEMVGGSLNSQNGGLFYTTNTESTFYLSNVDITSADDSEFFLRATGNSNQRGWGSSGSNGADCSFTADSQTMEGDVIWDSISNLDFYMMNGSALTGAVTDDEANAGSGGSGYCNVYISSDSKWIVTGNSTVTNLYNAGEITDKSGNTVSIVGTDGTVYQYGTSQYTITVDTYSESADFSGTAYSTATPSFTSYSVEKPSELTKEVTAADASAEESATSADEEENDSKASAVAIVFLIVAAVVIVGAVVTVIIVDKKKKPKKESEKKTD